MLDLVTTEAFAAWFAGLPAGPAEDVAAAVEIIGQLAPEKDAPGTSDMLLWYEHPSVSQVLANAPAHAPQLTPELTKFLQDWGQLASYAKRVVKHLESPAFVARLAKLPAGAASEVKAAVDRIRRATTTRALRLSDFTLKRRFFVTSPPTPADVATLTRLADVGEVRQAFFAALAAAGLEVADIPLRSTALREMSLRTTTPGIRILYGIDEPRRRGLLVLGEWLDRSFYGDSVRSAEAAWARFLEGDSVHIEGGSPAR